MECGSFKILIYFFEKTEIIFAGGLVSPGNYMFKVDSINTRASPGICSKLTIKTPERRQWRRSGIRIINFEHVTPCSSVNFEQVNATWGYLRLTKIFTFSRIAMDNAAVFLNSGVGSALLYETAKLRLNLRLRQLRVLIVQLG